MNWLSENSELLRTAFTALAVVVSAASILISLRINSRLQKRQHQFQYSMMRMERLSEVRRTIAPVVRQASALIQVHDLGDDEALSKEQIETVVRCYREIRDTYLGVKHIVDEHVEKEIDDLAKEIEEKAIKSEQIDETLIRELNKALVRYYVVINKNIDDIAKQMNSMSN